jgi:transglutaminase-like putative cysteine protease
MSVRSDAFANHVVELRATDVGAWIEFAAWARVTHRGPGGQASVPIRAFTDRRLLRATPLTEADDALRDAASRLAAAGAGGVALAERICAWVHGTMTYEDGVTGVDTTAAAALAGGRGVCQDYAHVMLAVGRAAGLPCRYVSGHLVGEGGSHAWVEAVVPDASPAGAGRAVAIAFDPTHDRRAVTGYLTVAVGRDYADVAPTSGTFEGDGPGVLTACKQLTRLAAETTEPVATASP